MRRVARPLIYVLALAAASAAAQQQRPFDKQGAIWLDYDMEHVEKAPAEYVTGQLYEFTDGTFFQQTKEKFDLPRVGRKIAGQPKEAYNVNSLDEVPDSSWFTNRNGRKQMSLEEIRRGPNSGAGMADGPLTVVRGKTSGISAGFWVKDSRGDTYILKFDRKEYPEMATAAEVIATKLFHAAGYNVPENNICHFRREQLRIDPDAKFKDRLGFAQVFTEKELDEILKLAYQLPDGRYRCLASKLLPGKPVGGFAFSGVRKDDPNDIIPHEHRRDVRGLRVFAAWLEHNDFRPGNTLDVYVNEDGRKYVRHCLIDLGSTLGSDTILPNKKFVGRQHILDTEESLKSFFSFGIYQPPWLERERPGAMAAVGHYTAEEFDAEKWKSNFPLVAFDNMTERDAHWAAKIVASFSDEQIAAAVETGEISSPAARQYLVNVISRRRDAIARRFHSKVAALGGFRVETRAAAYALRFEDLRVKHSTGEPSTYVYDIEAAGKRLAGGTVRGNEVTLNEALLRQMAQAGTGERDRGVARLTLARAGERQSVQVYLWRKGDGLEIVGIEN